MSLSSLFAEIKALFAKHGVNPNASVSGRGHLVFVPPAQFLLPAPANYAYDAPDQYGALHTWAHDEIVAEVQQFGQIDSHHQQYAQAFLAMLKDRDQVSDAASAGPLTPDAAKAINLATRQVGFENVPAWKDGMGPDGQVLVNPKPTIAAWAQQYTLATLIDGYRTAFQHNLSVGYDGTQPVSGA